MAVKQRQAFSRKHLLAFVATFAVIGGAILLNSYADNPNLTGDINNDNRVDITDMSLLLSSFGSSSSTSDLNDDGVVNIFDLSILLTHYGRILSVQPPTLTFSANPTSINSGQTSTLNWSTTNATTCTASGAWSGTKSTSGSQSVTPTSTSTYTMTCTGTGGSINRSVTITVSSTPPPPPPSSNITCTKTITVSSGNLQSFVDSVTSGQTGCLRAGTYNSGITFRNSGATIASYPGERATVNGYLEVSRGANGVKMANLNLTITGNDHNMRVYGNNTIIEGNDITNNRRQGSGACISVGGSQDTPSGVVIRGNIIHDCGSNLDNLNHGIYANGFIDLTIIDNIFYLNGGYSIQLYPNGTRATVSHNVIDGSNEYSVRGGIIIDGTTAVNHTVEYNIIAYAKTAGITARTGSGHVARNNCFYSNSGGDISGSMTQSGNVNANPMFVNRSARNYQLSSGSPCLNVVGYDTAKKLAGQ